MFEQAYVLEPADHRAGLELAYLRFETGQRALALELFRKLRQATTPMVSRGASDTTRRIESELSREIARWAENVKTAPANWSAHQELAGLYDEYGDPQQAAEHYEAAWRVQPPRREEMLLRLARRESAPLTRSVRGEPGCWPPIRATRASRRQRGNIFPGDIPTPLSFAALWSWIPKIPWFAAI